jgi:hypothetical protein
MCPICRKNGGLLSIININNLATTPIHGIHKVTVNKVTSKSNTITSICGFKLKTKDGYCQVIGKEKYNGLCGIHCKNKLVETLNVNDLPGLVENQASIIV